MKVKELLTEPSKWTQGEFARDIKGNPVRATNRNAVAWCLVGAIRKCYPNIYDKVDIVDIISKNIDGSFLDWNDHPDRTFDDVCKLIQELDI